MNCKKDTNLESALNANSVVVKLPKSKITTLEKSETNVITSGFKWEIKVFNGYLPYSKYTSDLYLVTIKRLGGRFTSKSFILHELDDRKKQEECLEELKVFAGRSINKEILNSLLDDAFELVDSDRNNDKVLWVEDLSPYLEGFNDKFNISKQEQTILSYFANNPESFGSKKHSDFDSTIHDGIYLDDEDSIVKYGEGVIAIKKEVLFNEIIEESNSKKQNLIKQQLVKSGLLIDTRLKGFGQKTSFGKGTNNGQGVNNYIFRVRKSKVGVI